MAARHHKSRTLIAFCFIVWSLFVTQTMGYSCSVRTTNSRTKSPAGKSRASLWRQALKQCGTDVICIHLLMEYGGVLAADRSAVILPSRNGFRTEAEVQSFQRRAGISDVVVDGVRIELQPAALKALRTALDEARQRGLKITPRGSYPARRSYATTLALWRYQVDVALNHWIERGKLSERDAQALRSLSIQKQVAQVLALEVRQIYFGNGFRKSILQSVAIPGGSQHNLMLALDIAQYDDPRVRTILNKHGWFQTVKNDAPHFTYLGVRESELPALGLKREIKGGMTFWFPALDQQIDTRKVSPTNRVFNGTMSVNVKVTETLREPLSRLTDEYFAATGDLIHITSGYRSPEAQASAMYRNLRAFGVAHVLNTYGGKAAAIEIINAYQQSPENRSQAIKAMAAVIERQIHSGIYISRHLLGKAVDVRLRSAREPTLNRIVRGLGGRLAVEIDHYHVEFK